MSIQIHPLPAFEDNYIWAIRSGDAVVVVDPGESAPVQRYLEASGARLCAILVTHRHGDHTEGIAALTAQTTVPVFGPALENIAGVSHPVTGGQRIEVPQLGMKFEVIALPGHTRGHVAYYACQGAAAGLLFCGDVLFGGGCGRVFEGTMAQMQASLATLAALPAATAVHCAHEYTQANLRFARAVEPDNPALLARIDAVARLRAAGQPTVPSTLAEELATNPFLRWDAPAVIAAATARRGAAPHDAIEVFTAIRQWKDGFRA
ncbi:MAG: hydroxyacylglutathione hydrolase [Gammaproteobacteria bacterium]|nr:hydroxyacylglutathione hydrolase [Gammaproteobacteria bacterium]MBU1645286.1 hydroxyacylglutathione hydrolase [Gammaproteobacteria bacterium]MBU1971623.1 hydroxyacylglutathione hydrolase [Gammaproteobacteria bacterium]